MVVPPGNTGLDPSQASFFQVRTIGDNTAVYSVLSKSSHPCHVFFLIQVLNIPTKINKGSVEIVAHVDLIKKGDKVGSSEAALLAKLGIRPFSYGLVITDVYEDGLVFSLRFLTSQTKT